MLAVVGASCGDSGPSSSHVAGKDVRILLGYPEMLDPAAQGDIGSAAVSAQLYEGLTAFDPGLDVRPALAESWEVFDGGRRVVFHLRDGLTFSDGSPITAADVVRSWLRIIDPDRPSPLFSLMADVENAQAYQAGDVGADQVGLSADGSVVEVRLARPAADFVSIVAGPTFAVVPPSVVDEASAERTDDFVGSGAYRLESLAEDRSILVANERYWAGPPAIGRIELVHDIGGRSTVTAFTDGEIDMAGISPFDASWIAYDERLGPQLREAPALGTLYFGFAANRPPFDDPRVRLAFAHAVDWRRIHDLVATDPSDAPTSMVPPGIPGRSATDFLPDYDPDLARQLLAEAGFARGAGFPEVTFRSLGTSFDEAVVEAIGRELGIDVAYETIGGDYYDRLHADPADLWTASWIADYPGANDFLGILLGSGSSNNYGNWSSSDFDAAIAAALGTADPADATAGFDRAMTVVRDEAPVVPLEHGTSWTLVREGLLGASDNGIGVVRMAGLAWAP